MGGDSNGLNKQIYDLHLRIDGNKDKIEDATSKNSEDQAELESLKEHVDVISAISKRDVSKAVKSMDYHVSMSLKRALGPPYL